MIIYHNPRCSKSRQSLALLRENGEEPEVIEYLKTSLDEVALRDLFAKLGLEAHEVVRTKEETPRQLDGDSIGPGRELRMRCVHGRVLVRVPR